MQKRYYVSHDGNNQGPFSTEDIAAKIHSGQLLLTDYIYDESRQDWTLMMEFGPLSEKFKAKKPAAPPPSNKEKKKSPTQLEHKMETSEQARKTDVTVDASDEWYVLKWDNRYGPFSYGEVIKMLQEKTVFEFDFAWKKGLEAWVRIAELSPFSHEAIKKVKSEGLANGSDVSEPFFRRRHIRTEFNGSIVIHDNKKVWKGKSIEISEGGAGVVMFNAMVLPGQRLYVHFKPGDNVPPFNALVEVVSKKFQKGLREADAAVSYGVKFVEINKGAQKAIQEFVAAKAA